MRDIVGHTVNAHRHLGSKRAIDTAARLHDITPRRVIGFLRGEVDRVWADELEHARKVYARVIDIEAAKRRAEEEEYERRRDELSRRYGCGFYDTNSPG